MVPSRVNEWKVVLNEGPRRERKTKLVEYIIVLGSIILITSWRLEIVCIIDFPAIKKVSRYYENPIDVVNR
jgi:hypothetical protein